MHNKKLNYTFLLTKKTNSEINIRRIEISNKLLKSFIFSLFLIVFSFSALTFGLFRDGTLTEKQIAALTSDQPLSASNPVSYKTISYQRPDTSSAVTGNAGGPDIFTLSNVDSEEEEESIEKQLKQIEITSSASFLPTMWAHLGKINNEFGYRRNPFGGRSYEFHPGLDIDGEKGDVVAAPANGVVIRAGMTGGYGNLIEVDHGNGLVTRYGHLSQIDVQEGDVIKRGQLIGLIGSTGRSTGPHLHFEIRVNDKPINPRRFLPPEPAEIRALNNQ